MNRKILIHPIVKEDLIGQFLFIAADNEKIADRFIDQVEETFQNLLEMPEMGSPYSSQNKKLSGIRKWRIRDFEKHLIFYRPTENGIEIIRVLYATRDIESLLEEM